MALKYHPDKLQEKDSKAGEMFQKILGAYNILKDPKKREIYDRTGVVSEKDPESITQFVEAYQFYREKFPELRTNDIESFEEKYRFSEEEENDLLEYFKDNEGDVRLILHNIILSRNQDVKRFIKFYENLLKSEEHKDELRNFKTTFNRTKTKIRKLNKKEAKEAKKIKEDRMASLKNAILLKNKARGSSFLDNLERAFVNEPNNRKKPVLKHNSKVTNQGKRKSPHLIKLQPKKSKALKKVKVSCEDQ
jgi:DnaJ family protein C protein 9